METVAGRTVAAGRLKKVQDDSSNDLETYTYGADRQKLSMYDGLDTYYYFWANGSIMAEYIDRGSPGPRWTKSYFYAGSRLIFTTSRVNSTTEKKETHHPDRLGTKIVTNVDSGAAFEQSTLPFGTAFGAESSGYSNQVFTSYDRSAATGLDYANNRTYSSGQGRFTQVDPIGMSAATIGNPQSNNMYAYTQNMPTDFVDPSGLNMAGPNTRYQGFDPMGVAYYIDGMLSTGWYAWAHINGGGADYVFSSAGGVTGSVYATVQSFPLERLFRVLSTRSVFHVWGNGSSTSFDETFGFTALLDALKVLSTDKACASFFGLLDKRKRISTSKIKNLFKRVSVNERPNARGPIASTNGNEITLYGGFYIDGWFTGSPAPHSIRNPRQGRVQTILHEIGHVLGLLISPDNYGLPNDPNSPANRNEKTILDNCGKGLYNVPGEY